MLTAKLAKGKKMFLKYNSTELWVSCKSEAFPNDEEDEEKEER